MVAFIKNWFDGNARDIARYRVVANRIDALEPALVKLTDEQLRERSNQLRERVQKDYRQKLEAAAIEWDTLTDARRREEDRKIYTPVLDSVLEEAFALVREASKRTIGLRHYPVQLIGGMVLHDGRIAEMRTGEGKTLVATCPIYLNALLGKGAHLVTANDYLSKRDAVWNGPIYHLLGMSVGIIQGQSAETGSERGSYMYDPDYRDSDPRFDNARKITRAEAYAADITYGTNNEYGFDYLYDNMAFSSGELVQPELHYAIVDEVDSILIDEARTPLIISGMVEQSTENYVIIDRVVSQMRRGIDDPKKDKDNPDADKLKADIHYVVDEKQKTATITDAGVAFIEKALGIDNISDNQEMMHYLTASMKAHGVFRKDIDYVVKTTDPANGPEIIIVDENTGRLMFGRRYSDGLHQAIEAKEHVDVKNESQTLATITFQNYFRLYSKLAGMTGTAKTEEDEFRKIYALDVVLVPTNRDIVRLDHPDLIFKAEEPKLRGIAAEILRVYCKQQPVLVGTRSIEMSERVSARVGPQTLATLCLIEVARNKMEGSKSLDVNKKRDITQVLNERMEASVAQDEKGNRVMRPALTQSRLKPILKELGIDPDPLTPENMNEIARIFEVAEKDYERLEEALTHGIEHRILNAKFHEKEAIIIAEAGRKGAVTIATNMAGRGVDILLGGKHINQELPPVDGSLKSLTAAEALMSDDATDPADAEGEEEEQSYMRYGRPRVLEAVTTGALTDEEHKAAAAEVRSLGGLFILGTERHESRRIDNQLRGRAGRQGDPGESRFMVSLEDELWRLFGDRASHPFLKTWEEHLGMDSKILSPMIQRAQRKVEEHYFESRKHVLNYDDVMNRQRELIYKERRRILEGVDLRPTITSFITNTIEDLVRLATPPDQPQDAWNLDELFVELDGYFVLSPVLSVDDLHGKSASGLIDMLSNHVLKVYESKEQELDALQGEGTMSNIERWMALRAVNSRWMEHLANMDYLREGIGLRGYEQKDPLLIYQKEAFDEFERMQQSIQDDIVRNVMRIQIVIEPPADPTPPPPQVIKLPENLPKFPTEPIPNQPRMISTNFDEDDLLGGGARGKDGAPANWKGGRNDPCWCGSGQKYKKCHGK